MLGKDGKFVNISSILIWQNCNNSIAWDRIICSSLQLSVRISVGSVRNSMIAFCTISEVHSCFLVSVSQYLVRYSVYGFLVPCSLLGLLFTDSYCFYCFLVFSSLFGYCLLFPSSRFRLLFPSSRFVIRFTVCCLLFPSSRFVIRFTVCCFLVLGSLFWLLFAVS